MALEMSYIEKVVENTKTASEQWDKFAAQCEDIETFKKAFHLRPTSKKVTIVCTLEPKPMRGAYSAKTKVAQFLKGLYEEELHTICKKGNTNKDYLNLLTLKKFEDRKIPKEKKAEEKYQAAMINSMAENKDLKSFLNVNELFFVASE